MNFQFTFDLVPEALRIMVLCMAGIFLVLGIIYVACLLLQQIFPAE